MTFYQFGENQCNTIIFNIQKVEIEFFIKTSFPLIEMRILRKLYQSELYFMPKSSVTGG